MIRNRIIGGDFRPYYRAVLLRAVSLGYVIPPLTCQHLQDRLIYNLITAGIWDQLDGLWVFSMKGGPAQFGTINLKNPTGTLATLENSPNLTFNDETGINNDGTVGHIDTKFAPLTHGVNFTQNANSAFIGLTINSGSSSAFVDFGNPNTRLRSLIAANTASYRCNTGSDNNATIPASSNVGLHHLQRRGSADQRLWKNGSNVGTTANASAALSASTFFLCAQNNPGFGNPSPCRVGCFGVGGSLVGKEVALNAIWQEYLTELTLL